MELHELFEKRDWSEEDFKAFLDLIERRPAPEIQAYFLENYMDHLSKQELENEEHAAALLRKIHREIKPRVVPMWTRIAAVAAVLLIAVATYVIFIKPKLAPDTAKHEPPRTMDVNAPGVNKATIVLANGKSITLDSAGNGTLAMEGKVKLEKISDGQIRYIGTANTIQYNRLVNPRGSKVVDMVLSDGTHVWLNSESELKYPTAFTGETREVEVTGEAYFEVAHDAFKPFRVKKGTTEVTVLGTHFDVNAYDDEREIKVTLMQGSVRVSNATDSIIIKPGQQATIAEAIKVKDDVDLDGVLAWQRGMFEFNNSSLETILKQVGRWYDVEVVYEQKPNVDHLGGGISRNLSLSKVLSLLEAYGAKFKFEGKKLIVQ